MQNRKKPKVICDPSTPGTRLTEQEHKPLTDIKNLLKIAARGGSIPTRPVGQYGEELNLGSRTELLLKKQQLETELNTLADREKIDRNELLKNPTQTLNTHLRKKHEAKKAELLSQDAKDKSPHDAKGDATKYNLNNGQQAGVNNDDQTTKQSQPNVQK